MRLHQPSEPGPRPPQFAGRRFVSLRTKFVVFFSLILILTCSTLSGYFLETRRAVMTDNLHRLGTILLTSVVNNRQLRYGGLIAEDRATLQQFTESLIAVEDVVYVVIRGMDGMILAQQNKLVRESSGSLTFTQERRYYPDERIAQALYRTPVQIPQMTPVTLSGDKILEPKTVPDDWFFSFSPLTEHVYDFAMPVLRQPSTDPSHFALPLQFEDATASGPRREPTAVQGVIQIGMSDAHAMHSLLGMIRNTLLLTALIIGIGILGAHVLTMRITTPIRSLASVAHQLAEGQIPPPLAPTTYDEVGQLTGMFNTMTQALHERNLAINTNLEIIQRQVLQLSAVHQTSAAITSTLDLHQLLDTVLQLLITNLGFSRMLLLLRRDSQDIAYVAQIAGVSPDVMEAARHIEIPITDGDTLIADLLIHARPVHVHRLEAASHRIHPAMLQLARHADVTSFVAVPLQIHGRTLGVLVGDRNALPCTGEDLSILETIAGHVAAAIDNARAYAGLTELTQNLEQRIQARTQELSVANERLQDHDRRRSMFVSVASHELRTPMTAIRSFADNMRDGITGPLTERQFTYLNRIGHNLDRLTRIINQLLDWSRLDLHKDVLRLEPLCIQQTANLVVDSLQHLAAQKKVCLVIEHRERTPPIYGERDKVEQILWNLLGNAVKFTPPEGRVTVEFTATADRFVQITVTDTGCGIQPADLPRIFNEFSKVSSAMPGSQGAQLGLCITKTLITMHGGSIRVESTPGVGTRVIFTLPIADPQPLSEDETSASDSLPDIERCEP
jgi:two-component system, sensor histidine kinase and response regulator